MSKRAIAVTAIFCCIMTGCTSPLEPFRKILGTSVQTLKNTPNKPSLTVTKDFETSYKTVLKCLNAMESLIWLQSERRQHIVAMGLQRVYRDTLDTTEVGIFFTRTAPEETTIEVSSLNSRLAAFVREKIRETFEYGKPNVNLLLTPAEQEAVQQAPQKEAK